MTDPKLRPLYSLNQAKQYAPQAEKFLQSEQGQKVSQSPIMLAHRFGQYQAPPHLLWAG